MITRNYFLADELNDENYNTIANIMKESNQTKNKMKNTIIKEQNKEEEVEILKRVSIDDGKM